MHRRVIEVPPRWEKIKKMLRRYYDDFFYFVFGIVQIAKFVSEITTLPLPTATDFYQFPFLSHYHFSFYFPHSCSSVFTLSRILYKFLINRLIFLSSNTAWHNLSIQATALPQLTSHNFPYLTYSKKTAITTPWFFGNFYLLSTVETKFTYFDITGTFYLFYFAAIFV